MVASQFLGHCYMMHLAKALKKLASDTGVAVLVSITQCFIHSWSSSFRLPLNTFQFRRIFLLSTRSLFALQITNNVVFDPVNGTKPSLGRTWLTVPNVRVELKRPARGEGCISSNVRQAVLTKSCRQVRC